MARPSTHADLHDFQLSEAVATFHLDQFGDNPAAVKAYGQFLEATGNPARANTVTVKGAVAEIRRRRTTEELDELLENAQRAWDSTRKRYTEVWTFSADGGVPGGAEELSRSWQDYEAYTLRTHALAEHQPLFPLIDADDAVRAAARKELGL